MLFNTNVKNLKIAENFSEYGRFYFLQKNCSWGNLVEQLNYLLIYAEWIDILEKNWLF